MLFVNLWKLIQLSNSIHMHTTQVTQVNYQFICDVFFNNFLACSQSCNDTLGKASPGPKCTAEYNLKTPCFTVVSL